MVDVRQEEGSKVGTTLVSVFVHAAALGEVFVGHTDCAGDVVEVVEELAVFKSFC